VRKVVPHTKGRKQGENRLDENPEACPQQEWKVLKKNIRHQRRRREKIGSFNLAMCHPKLFNSYNLHDGENL
jgi:hypothetical protein